MRYVPFGSNAVDVSEVVLGTMRIGGMTPQQVATLIETGVDSGINAVDTAPIYGPSERLIGEALSLRPGLRDRIWLQTKLGIRHHPRVDANYFDFSYGLGDDARGVVRGVPLGGKQASLGSPIGHTEAHSLRWERMRLI